MKQFKCPKCDYSTEQPYALEAWHKCGIGKRAIKLDDVTKADS